MKLHNVIGGLEEKEVKEIMALFVKTHCEGHNQLCNREVEYDRQALRKELEKPIVVNDYTKGYIGLRDKDLILEIVGKAISQGKVIKVVE